MEEISKSREDILNELSNTRHTELKGREPLRKYKNNKKNTRLTNLGNYSCGSIMNKMAVGMNEYNELVYTTAKVVTEVCSPKEKRKLNAKKKPSWGQKMEIEHLQEELSILSELERGTNVKGKMCKKLKRKYKLIKEIIRVKERVKQNAT